MKIKVIIVEDDDTSRELLKLNLNGDVFETYDFFSAEAALKNADFLLADFLLLDIMLPGISGIALAEELRLRNIFIPIIFMTALEDKETVEKAMSLGAIDYIIKPFQLDLLIRKIENLQQVYRQRPALLPVSLNGVKINWDMNIAEKNGKPIQMSANEAAALRYFLNHPEKIISREEFIHEIWRDKYTSNRSVDNLLVTLRKIFEKNPAKPVHFITYPKSGYAFIPIHKTGETAND